MEVYIIIGIVCGSLFGVGVIIALGIWIGCIEDGGKYIMISPPQKEEKDHCAPCPKNGPTIRCFCFNNKEPTPLQELCCCGCCMSNDMFVNTETYRKNIDHEDPLFGTD